MTSEIVYRVDAEHLEECRVRVDDLSVQRRYINSFLQPARKLAERFWITQAAKSSSFFGFWFSGGLETTHIIASANGTSVA
jgi:hypothetical protein